MTNRTNKALLSFMGFSEARVLAFADAVIKALTGNSNFPNAAPLLATLVTAQDAYAASLAIAKDGNRMQAAEKNVAQLAVFEALRALCNMVNFTADGDRVILLSSGFNVSKDITTPVVIEPAKNVIVNYGANSGEMDVTVKGVKGHKGLVFEYAVATAENKLAADAGWVSLPSSTTQCTLVNMPVGQRVLIRVGIAGARKQLVYTTPVAKLVA